MRETNASTRQNSGAARCAEAEAAGWRPFRARARHRDTTAARAAQRPSAPPRARARHRDTTAARAAQRPSASPHLATCGTIATPNSDQQPAEAVKPTRRRQQQATLLSLHLLRRLPAGGSCGTSVAGGFQARVRNRSQKYVLSRSVGVRLSLTGLPVASARSGRTGFENERSVRQKRSPAGERAACRS